MCRSPHGISPDMVGGIELTYIGEESGNGSAENKEPADTTAQAGDYALAASTYTGSYTKESAMACPLKKDKYYLILNE